MGEIDIVCMDGDALVIVEVKSRLAAPGAERYLFETITPRQRSKLRVLAEIYAARLRSRRIVFRSLRIDVVGVVTKPGGAIVSIKHLRGAV